MRALNLIHRSNCSSEADWPCLHSGNARWAGRVKVIKRVIFVWKTGMFFYLVKVEPVEWSSELPGPVISPSPSLLFMYFTCYLRKKVRNISYGITKVVLTLFSNISKSYNSKSDIRE